MSRILIFSKPINKCSLQIKSKLFCINLKLSNICKIIIIIIYIYISSDILHCEFWCFESRYFGVLNLGYETENWNWSHLKRKKNKN